MPQFEYIRQQKDQNKRRMAVERNQENYKQVVLPLAQEKRRK